MPTMTKIVLANNNYIAFKQALKIALGGKGLTRQVFKERKLYGLVFQNDSEETEYEFGDLNYKYVEELPVSDITIFNNEEYGKFFYEYGRTILANLMICLTKADWNSVSQLTNDEAEYVNKYFASLTILDNHVESVIESFKKNAISEEEYSEFNINYKKASDIIKCYKNEFISYKNSKDMRNSDIFYCAYIGLMFTLYGLILILCQNEDVFSFLKSPMSKSSLSLIKNILTNLSSNSEDDEGHPKKHFISMLYAYSKMTTFYKNVSGYDKLDSLIGTLFDLADNFVSKIDLDEENDIKNMISKDFVEEGIYSSGINLKSFTSAVDPLLEFLQFKSGCIISNDNTDIWEFGRVYIQGYNCYKTENEYKSMMSELKPVMKDYLASCMKDKYSKEEMTRIFGIVTSYLSPTNIEEYAEIDPGFMLQLTMVASAFRIIENRNSDSNVVSESEINGAIDIIDTLIVKLYEMWFKSGKYFHQQYRPNYAKSESCNDTLKYLKSEVDLILLSYLEFVRYGNTLSESDINTFKSLKESIIFALDKEHLDELVSSKYPFVDQDTFIRLCAKREGRTIVQTVFENNTEYDLVNLISKYENKELSKYYITNYASEPKRHTGISIIDRAIDNSKEARNSSLSNPEIYAIAVIGIIWVYFEDIFRNKNVGNYFDFGNASASLNSYKIEHTVTQSLLVPLKRKYSISSI